MYALFIKHGVGCTLRYGRQTYDYQEGKDMSGLIFHPDLIYGTSLADKMNCYTYFSYSQTEALHLSEQEQQTLTNCLHNIQTEMEHPIDRHSRELLCVQIELFLDYCLRFYVRQFYTHSKVNSDVLQQFEQTPNSYFNSDEVRRQGLPFVRYFADKACMSPGYFGDLIKKETGKTAQKYIQLKIIDLSNQYLLGTGQTISQIADLLGFQYPQHFIRIFKKQTGQRPKENCTKPRCIFLWFPFAIPLRAHIFPEVPLRGCQSATLWWSKWHFGKSEHQRGWLVFGQGTKYCPVSAYTLFRVSYI